jgi:hypothetical protein
LRREDYEFEVNLGNIARPLYKKNVIFFLKEKRKGYLMTMWQISRKHPHNYSGQLAGFPK